MDINAHKSKLMVNSTYRLKRIQTKIKTGHKENKSWRDKVINTNIKIYV